MNTLIERLPKPETRFSDQPVRLTNASGDVVIDIDSAGAALVQQNARRHLDMDQHRSLLVAYFSDPISLENQLLYALQEEVQAWTQMAQHPMLNAPGVR